MRKAKAAKSREKPQKPKRHLPKRNWECRGCEKPKPKSHQKPHKPAKSRKAQKPRSQKAKKPRSRKAKKPKSQEAKSQKAKKPKAEEKNPKINTPPFLNACQTLPATIATMSPNFIAQRMFLVRTRFSRCAALTCSATSPKPEKRKPPRTKQLQKETLARPGQHLHVFIRLRCKGRVNRCKRPKDRNGCLMVNTHYGIQNGSSCEPLV